MGIRILETSVTYNTIQAAIDAALNGVGLTSNLTIEIDGGVYYENLYFNGSAHKTNAFTLLLKNASGQVVELDGSGTANYNIYILNLCNITFDGISANNCNPEDTGGANVRILGTSLTWGKTDNITFKNATIRAGYAASRCTDYVRNVTFQNVTTSNCRYGTFRFGKQQVDLQNVNFINCNITTDGLQDVGANQFQLKGIDGLNIIRCNIDGAEKIILSPWFCDNVVIDGCIFKRPGILTSTGRHIIFEDSCDNWLIQNCLFIDCDRQAPIYGTNMTEITFKNNTFIDTSSSKTSYFYLSNINGLYMYNNIYQMNGAGTIGVIIIANSTSNTINTKFITSNNIIHYINGTQRNLYNGTSGGITLPTGGVTGAQTVGLETNSLQSILTTNYLAFIDTANSDYTLQESSPARNIALMSQIPVKDLRNYTRDVTTSDIGAYDMNGIQPILPTAILIIKVNNIPKTQAFGIEQNTQVTFSNNSLNAITTTFEIFNSNNTVIGASSVFPFTYTFSLIGIYNVKLISTNNDGSSIVDLKNYIVVDTLPTPLFAISGTPKLLNGESATFDVSDSSVGGSTSLGGITSRVWEIVDESNNSIYQTNITPFTVTGVQAPQGSYGIKLTTGNIVGNTSTILSNAILVNRTPTLVNNIPNQVATRNNTFSYIIPNDIFSDGTDVLTYTIDSAPIWLTLTESTLSGTPTNIGSSAVIIRATDSNSLYATTTFNISIGSGEPPTVVNLPQNKGIIVGSQFNYKILPSIIFYSPDPITITIIQKPSWLNYISDELLLIGEPKIADVGTNFITIRADNGFTQADCTFTVEVFNIDNLSVINNSDQNLGIRTKLNSILNFINKFR